MTTLVVALGHPDRGDDAAGWLVADLLQPATDVVVRRIPGDPSRLLEDPLWSTADHVVVVDAVRTGAPPGTVHRWSVAALLRPGAATSGDTHGLGLVGTLALADALGRLPADLTIVGIEAARFHVGTPPSPEVRAAVEPAAALVRTVAAPPAARAARPTRRGG